MRLISLRSRRYRDMCRLISPKEVDLYVDVEVEVVFSIFNGRWEIVEDACVIAASMGPAGSSF